MPTEYVSMEYDDGVLRIDKELSTLDEFVVDVTSIFDDLDIRYIVVSGYVSILAGRSRSTEDVDTIVERLTSSETDRLVARLDEAGYWGATTPLEDLHEILSDDLRVRIAEEGRMTPNPELWFPRNEYDRRALENSVVADALDTRSTSVPPNSRSHTNCSSALTGTSRTRSTSTPCSGDSLIPMRSKDTWRNWRSRIDMPSLEELREQQRENLEQRREFVKLWAEYVRDTPDEEWSAEVNDVIDSQYPDDG